MNKVTATTSTNTDKTKIFISYAHSDEKWLNKVKLNLKVLQHEEYDFEIWDDNRIIAGQKWKDEIYNALNQSRIAILLISTEFLASDFITNDELPLLFKKAEEEGTIILPLIVSYCRFTNHRVLSTFQAANNPSNPLNSCNEAIQQKTLVDLANVVEFYLNQV